MRSHCVYLEAVCALMVSFVVFGVPFAFGFALCLFLFAVGLAAILGCWKRGGTGRESCRILEPRFYFLFDDLCTAVPCYVRGDTTC